jgi:hypothetical protein
MWSGPRNISTAMMRAWENRADTTVVDEPFYACYLHATGVDHPMRQAVIDSQPTDWAEVARTLAEAPSPSPIFYQKHMTHHMLPGVNLQWTRVLTHCFLIRDPEEVVASYREKRSSLAPEDIGLDRQLALYREIGEITGQQIPVLDARQVLEDPRRALSGLCRTLGVPFLEEMLQWPAGRRASDGVWAPHWYQAVEASTGFRSPAPRGRALSVEERRVAEACRPAYEALLRLSGGS